MTGATKATTPGPPTTQGGEDWRAGIRRSRGKQLIVLAVTALLVALGAWALGHKTDVAAKDPGLNGAQPVELKGAQSGPPPEVGKPAQDFTATTVKGEKISLAGLKGRPVWLTFGASWCTACRAEAPDLQSAYTAAKASGLEVVSVNLSETSADIVGYAGRVGLTFPQVADPDTALASRYRVMGLPSHYFIDKDGVIRSIHIGGLTRSAMDAELAKIAG